MAPSAVTAPKVYMHVDYFRMRAARLRPLLSKLSELSEVSDVPGLESFSAVDSSSFSKFSPGAMTFEPMASDGTEKKAGKLRVFSNGTLCVSARSVAACRRLAHKFVNEVAAVVRRNKAVRIRLEDMNRARTHVTARVRKTLDLHALCQGLRVAAPAGWRVSYNLMSSAALMVRTDNGCSAQLFASGKVVATTTSGLDEARRLLNVVRTLV